jgi:hypothetical protein
MRHGLERAGNRTEWRTRGQQREEAFGKNRFHGKSTGPDRHQEPSGKQITKTSPELDRILDSHNKRRENHQEQAREQDNERDQDGRTR